MKIKEMQKQVESMMSTTPKQVVENMDKKLEEKRERIVYNILSEYAKFLHRGFIRRNNYDNI